MKSSRAISRVRYLYGTDVSKIRSMMMMMMMMMMTEIVPETSVSYKYQARLIAREEFSEIFFISLCCF